MKENPKNITVTTVDRTKGFLPQILTPLKGGEGVLTSRRELLIQHELYYTQVHGFRHICLSIYTIHEHLKTGKFSFKKETMDFDTSRTTGHQSALTAILNLVRNGMTLHDIKAYYEL